MDKDKLKQALLKDFETLYVKEFTTDWKAQRFVRELEIRVMGVNHLEKTISQAIEEAVKEERKRIIDFINTDEMIDRGDILGLLEEEIE